jgi:WhiB family redox-sensing transcriptional regulator
VSTVRDTGPPPVDRWPLQACRNTDTRVFFPGKEGGGRDWGLERLAKSICQRCAAMRQCRAYAIPIADLGGIWGSMNENERTRVRKKRAAEAAGSGARQQQKEAPK